jgi:hypothetical protein
MSQFSHISVARRDAASSPAAVLGSTVARPNGAESVISNGGFRPTDKKKIMRMIAKLAHVGIHGQRSALSDVIDHVKRACSVKSYRRGARPLQDLDNWSDQAEVAYYEDCLSGRCL